MSATLVIGGTGAMGSRVVAQLLARTGDDITVLTRTPNSARATALKDTAGDRLRLVEGDVSDPRAIQAALTGVSKVFCNTDFFSSQSPFTEFTQGTAILEAARQHRVDRFVWSSLDSTATLTAGRRLVPHYEAKAAVAAHIHLHRSEEMMRRDPDGWYREHVSILTTSPYFENLLSRLSPDAEVGADARPGDSVTFTLPLGSGRYPMIGLDDIAWFAVHMLQRWQSWGARDLAVSADSLTGAEIAATFERVTGIAARYRDLPLSALADIPQVGHDYAAMFGFFQEHDLITHDRDRDQLRRIHPALMTFEDWLRRTGWDGRHREVQQFTPQLTPANGTEKKDHH